MRNIRLLISYDGADFHGWQRQPCLHTIQETLESRIARVTGKPVKLYGSGRTDAGVHAAGQVANFKTACPIPCQNLVKALNDSLPVAIRVRDAEEVDPWFHARFDARVKTYRYRIVTSPVCPPFLARYVYHHPYRLNYDRMSRAARMLEGERDFTSFAGSDPADKRKEKKQSDANIRKIFDSRVLVRNELSLVTYQVCGSGFLYHMVRNIVGTLLEVGSGMLQPEEVVAILDACDRNKAGPTAPASGLCLIRVEY